MTVLDYEGISGNTIIQAIEIPGNGCIVRFTSRVPGRDRVESQCAVFVPGIKVRDGKLVPDAPTHALPRRGKKKEG